MIAGAAGTQPPGGISTIQRMYLDSMPPPWSLPAQCIIPEAIHIYQRKSGQEIPASAYEVVGNTIIWKAAASGIPFPLEIVYRSCPAWLHTRLGVLRPATKGTVSDSSSYLYSPYTDVSPWINFRKLDYSGRFSRGIAVGNRQDLALQSGFNLQLAGDMGDGIELHAAISDEQLPVQPEGTSLQLRDFDRVYVQLKRRGDELIAGDYDLQSTQSLFLRYANRLQGAQLKHQGIRGTQQAAFAVTRGKFARYQLPVQEGNQGPYPLKGATGERFIVLLAGTERVWYNGVPLQRGSDQDYTIDYNRGALTFTARRRIGRESRITIEYEYADQNFVRSVYAFNSEYTHNTFRAYLQWYNRQDSRNPTSNLSLDLVDQEQLYTAGDNPEKAFISGVQSNEAFSPGRVFYLIQDTITSCGRTDSILRFTNDPNLGKYTARFSYLGPGKGSYKLDERPIANDRVFYWIAPDPGTCQLQGEYEPILQLSPPQQQQMVVIGQEWMPSPRTSIRSEFAMSKLDKNRLSPLDQQDDLGSAAFVALRHNIPLQSDTNGWNLQTKGSVEILHRNFQPITPYRSPDFLRDWSLTDFQGIGIPAPARELLYSAEAQLTHSRIGSTTYSVQQFERRSSYKGSRQGLYWDIHPTNWVVQGNVRIVQARTPTASHRFWRPELDIRKMFPKIHHWAFLLQLQGEQNARTLPNSSLLEEASFAFQSLRVGIESPPEKPWGWSTAYLHRADQVPKAGIWHPATLAREWILRGYWQKQRAVQLNGNLHYRQLLTDTLTQTEKNRRTLLGRMDGTINAFKGALRSQTTYELGSGQEPRQEYTYIKVAPGEGTFIWQDSLYNADGIIQIAEMQTAPFPDQADYIRVSTISTRFIQTDYLNLSQTIQLEPQHLWKTPQYTFSQLLSKLSGQASWRIQQKTQAGTTRLTYTPFLSDITDTSLVSLNAGLRQSIVFNRAHPKWEVQWVRQDTRNKQIQTTGYELRAFREQSTQLRWNLRSAWSLRILASSGQRSSQVTWLNSRDYRLRFEKIESQLAVALHTDFRAQLHYRFQSDRNAFPGTKPKATTREARAEFTYTPRRNMALSIRISRVDIRLEGDARSPAGFAILNGLQPGKNWLWNLSTDRQLNRSLQLRVIYDGRKTGNNRVVHTGRVQVNAVF